MQQRLGDEWQIGKLHAVARFPSLAVLLAEPGDARHIHFENRMHVGASALGFHHTLGNLLAHRRHRNNFTGHSFNLWYRNRLRLRLLLRLLGLLLLRWARLRRRRAHHLWPASALAMLLDKALNIALADSPAQTSAGNLAEIDVVLTRHAAHQ